MASAPAYNAAACASPIGPTIPHPLGLVECRGASRVYGSGGAALLRAAQDTLLTQIVLDQAVAPEAAREQVRAVIELVRRFGTLDTEVVYEAKQFRYDVRWTTGK